MTECRGRDCQRRLRQDAAVLVLAVVLALLLVGLGVAVLGVHVCGDEVSAAVQLLRGDLVEYVSKLVGVANTFRGGRS